MSPTDIVILEAAGYNLAKTFNVDGSKQDPSFPKWWRWSVENLSPHGRPRVKDLEAFLKRMAKRRDCVTLRALPTWSRSEPGRRLLETIADTDRSWLCLDIDGIDLPVDVREGALDSPLGPAKYVVNEVLPKRFRGTSFVAKYSASAGRDGYKKAKLHLWFFLDRAVCSASLREWAMDALKGIVDVGPFGIASTLTVCDPVEWDDFAWSPRCRIAAFYGARPSVSLPKRVLCLQDWEAEEERREEKRAAAREEREALRLRRPAVAAAREAQKWAEVCLEQIERLELADEGERHEVLISAFSRLAWWGKELRVAEEEIGLEMDDLEEIAYEILPQKRHAEVKSARKSAVQKFAA